MRNLIYIFIFFGIIANGQEMVIDQWNGFGPSCTPLANNLHTDSNAANEKNCTEANTTTGWGTFGGSISLTSVSGVDGDGGIYAIRGALTAASTAQRIHYTFSGTSGQTLTVQVRARKTQGTNVYMNGWRNVTGGPSAVPLTTSWVTYTYNLTVTNTATCGLDFWAHTFSGTGAIGDAVEVAWLTIID